MLLLKQQRREAFDHLYNNYAAALLGLIKKIISNEQTAQDVLQESFVKVWKNIEAYDPGKGKLFTWMLNIARNTAIDKLRTKGEQMNAKIRSGEENVDIVSVKMQMQPSTDVIGLRNIVGNLKPEHEIVVDLAYYKGFTMEEISKQLQIPTGTVKTRMRNALKQLRETFNR